MTEPTLWTAVDCPCGKPPSPRASTFDAFSQNQIKLGFENLPEVVDAALDAIDLLSAQMQALQRVLEQIVDVIDGPLSPAESLHKLRQMREAL